MVNIFRGYVLTKDKKPISKFKDVDKLLTIDEVKDKDEYAGILNNEFVVLDIDDRVEANKTFNLIKDLKVNCRVVNTSRGKHFIFKKNPKIKLKGTTKNICALGFTFDIRIGVNQYIIVKYGGKVREIVQDFDESRDIALFPKSFAPINSNNKFTSMSEGDGRNGKLFAHIPILSNVGFTKEEIKSICTHINEYYFDAPLKEGELKTILRDESFAHLSTFNVNEEFGTTGFKPKSLSDLGMAELFSLHYKDICRYNESIGWITWNTKVWEIGELKAEQKYIEFLKLVKKQGLEELNASYSGSITNDEKLEAAKKYMKFVVGMESANKITSVLKLARSYMEISIKELDAEPFELNTPSGIIDLVTGNVLPHDSKKLCTKMTSVSVSSDNEELWFDLLNLVTNSDKEYQHFLQVLCGAATIGRVYEETLIIAHGEGHNGKSTMFNTIFKVLGDYSGKIPAESLTTKAKNIKVDLAELFGKRFILASETEEGQCLSNQMLKQIASSDAITGEKKYHDPFVFEPTHTALLYTNFLPRLGSLDNGTKRRIIICPFIAIISKPKKDYGEVLFKKAGGAVLKWLVEGAKMFIDAAYNLPTCKVAKESRDKYFEENDWLTNFINDCCIVGKLEKQSSGEVYKVYREWAKEVGEYPKRNRDFTQALQMAGFVINKTRKCNEIIGLSLDPKREVAKTFSEGLL